MAGLGDGGDVLRHEEARESPGTEWMLLFLKLKILLTEPSQPPLKQATLWGWLRRDRG